MRGRKPKLDNIIPMRSDPALAAADDARARVTRRAVRALRPRGLTPELQREWERVATLLAEPSVDRLKARFVDTILEYCICVVRLRNLRAALAESAKKLADKTGGPIDLLAVETYRSEGRNGVHFNTHPYVYQIRAAFDDWRKLVAMLGLSPADERNMLPGQGDLFDESEREFA